VYKTNLKFIEEHNKKNLGFTVAMNKFGDLTIEEFARLYLMTPTDMSTRTYQSTEVYSHDRLDDLADDIDWRLKNAVTNIKNEGQCGSCWAHSTAASIEGAWAIKKGVLNSLSAQQLVDCTESYGNNGCNGGLIDPSYQYIIDNQGIDTESSYPYEAQTKTCRFKRQNVGATISSFVDIETQSESSLQSAVLNIGPISGAIDAGQNSFQFYQSGVYYEPRCSPTMLDHGINIVGYGSTSNGTQYYIVKNMWGTNWGMQGYVLMARNRGNNCGIATINSYPIF
jgi:cathepsin L